MFFNTSNQRRITELELALTTLTQQVKQHNDDLPKVIAAAIAADKLAQAVTEQKTADERQSSSIPFVEIISDAYDPELGVQLQLDWNAAFIKELKSKGYVGTSERDIVNKWLLAMHNQIAIDIEKQDRV